MKILLIIAWMIVCMWFGCEVAHSSDFTVDQRSLYHVGVSAPLSGTCNAMTIKAKSPSARRAVCVSSALAIGAYKEFVMDAHPDYGDMAFNVVGAYLGIAVTDRLFVWLGKDTINISGTF